MRESMTRRALTALTLLGAISVVADQNPGQVEVKSKGGTVMIKPAGGQAQQAPKEEKLDFKKIWAFIPPVAAEVGDRKITREELLKSLKPYERQAEMMAKFGQKSSEDQFQKMALMLTDDLIDMYALMNVVEKKLGKPTAAMGEAEFKRISEEIAKRSPNGKKMTLEEMIKAQGLDVKEEKERMAQMALVRQYLEQEIRPTVKKVTDADAKKFYEENKDRFADQPETVEASHILIAYKGATRAKPDVTLTKEEAKKKAEDLVGQLKKGAKFEELAKTNSACPSGKNGGSLGPFGRGAMTPEFETAAFSLKPGEISGVVETPFGFHIIRTDKHQAAENKKFEDVKEEIVKQLSTMEEMKKLADLRDQAKKEIKCKNYLQDKVKIEEPK